MRLAVLMLLAPVFACAPQEAEISRAAAVSPPPGPTTEQLIAARRAGMHMAATLLYQGIKKAVRNGSDVREQTHDPDGIALWATAIPGLFPPGSLSPDSAASSTIWENRTDFEQKAADLRDAAARLLTLAEAGDTSGFATQADVVEARCNACHARYRSD